jgi:DNA-binding response OmpR family regulator
MTDTKPRILIVDDEPDLVAVLRMGLQMEGFDVLEAADGEEGLRRAQQDRPDLMLLDLMLPRMDGYQVCRTLKFDARYKSMPIFILSARPGDRDKRLAIEMGADQFISKPYDLKDLVGRIRRRLATDGRAAA